MKKEELVLNDALTYMKISTNRNYARRLREAYDVLVYNNIIYPEQFLANDAGIGAFSFTEITIFDRIKDQDYYKMLVDFSMNIENLEHLPDDYGDMLASVGTIGETPYRDEYIKKGYITEGVPLKRNK